jgi:hypothetical protein
MWPSWIFIWCCTTIAVSLFQARVNDELLIYEVFPYHAVHGVENRLKLRFKKYNHGLITGRKKPAAARAKAGSEVETSEDDRKSRMHWLKPFDDISGYSGVCVTFSDFFAKSFVFNGKYCTLQANLVCLYL